jgi:hypothetical protein
VPTSACHLHISGAHLLRCHVTWSKSGAMTALDNSLGRGRKLPSWNSQSDADAVECLKVDLPELPQVKAATTQFTFLPVADSARAPLTLTPPSSLSPGSGGERGGVRGERGGGGRLRQCLLTLQQHGQWPHRHQTTRLHSLRPAPASRACRSPPEETETQPRVHPSPPAASH